MERYLPGLPTDKELSGKKLLLVAETFDGESFINAHTDVAKFCKFYKQKPRHPNAMINIHVFIGKLPKCTICTYWGTMHYYCTEARSFEEMITAMRNHCEDEANRTRKWEV